MPLFLDHAHLFYLCAAAGPCASSPFCSGFVAWFVIYPHDLVNLLGTLAALAGYLAVSTGAG